MYGNIHILTLTGWCWGSYYYIGCYGGGYREGGWLEMGCCGGGLAGKWRKGGREEVGKVGDRVCGWLLEVAGLKGVSW